ncbi:MULTISPECIES: hypothetical protein [unclassified Streptomyces]|uniref:hypothetical protein n=1 Tax=unclassified Streptomyces TaxID=2593676 RepID=UPI000DC7BE84|nr:MULTISPECIES: hypothetical protein [unclassified Streptomyces]AWZ03411.1 hypothetical protein DRB89_00775 [Streptomyces sp. ICC4]AWZ11316.1 hypothetical protein DRB96_02105 [Streptomyces sp. ICC1]
MAAQVEFQYETPDISEEGDVVTWAWAVVNSGSEPAREVVMKHTVVPSLEVTNVTGPSEVVGEIVKSTWATLAAGEKAEGTITANLPEDLSGSVSIKGRVVWQADES